MNEIRYFSMFSGVGGFERGFEQANDNRGFLQGQTSSDIQERESNTEKRQTRFTCVGMSEFDKYSSQVLKYRFPGVKNWGDCTKIKPEELPDFDMLCGGTPCQAFSIAGKRRGFEDTRGTMFFEVARILEVKRPKIVLLENVKGLLNHAKGETFRVILQTLDELGYCVQWMVLNSKFFGVPQNRERVFIIGSLRGTSRSEILPFGTSNVKNDITIKRIGHMQGFRRYNQTFDESGITEAIDVSGGGGHQPCIRAVLTPDRANKRQNGRRFKEPGEPAFTVTSQDIHGIATDTKIRRLTPTECCRLQGFPDDWNEYGTNENGEVVKMSDTQRYKQMGNAVTTNVVAAVGSQLLKVINDKGGEKDE